MVDNSLDVEDPPPRGGRIINGRDVGVGNGGDVAADYS